MGAIQDCCTKESDIPGEKARPPTLIAIKEKKVVKNADAKLEKGRLSIRNGLNNASEPDFIVDSGSNFGGS